MLEQSSITVDNHKIITHISHVTFERCIILVHGLTGDMHGPANLYDKLTESLINTGYSVTQFNFRGTFPSEMDSSDMTLETERQDLEAIIHFVKERGYKELSLVGESMGVSVILAYEKFSQIHSLVFWYGAYNFMDTDFKNYLSEVNTENLLKQGYIEVSPGYNVGKDFITQIPNIKLLEKVKNIPCPIY